MKSKEIDKLFKRTMSFYSKMYKIKLIPKNTMSREESAVIIDKLIKSNDIDKPRFNNVKAYITNFDSSNDNITLKVVMINLRLNGRYFVANGEWAFTNSRFVDQNDTLLMEWYEENLKNYYNIKIERVYNLKTLWELDKSDLRNFEDNDYMLIRQKLRKLVKDSKFWDKYHYVRINNKRYFDMSLSNFMHTFNMNISDSLYKYKWKTIEDLGREFPINFYRKTISGADIKRLAYNAGIELEMRRKEDSVVTFNKMITLSGFFNITDAKWSIINYRVKYYKDEEPFNMVTNNLHYSSYENRSKDIIDEYLWLSNLFNFTGLDTILLKGE